jgi:hypothetical protein
MRCVAFWKSSGFAQKMLGTKVRGLRSYKSSDLARMGTDADG